MTASVSSGVVVTINNEVFTSHGGALCPDLLKLQDIGQADTIRGRIIRAFFIVMERWPW